MTLAKAFLFIAATVWVSPSLADPSASCEDSVRPFIPRSDLSPAYIYGAPDWPIPDRTERSVSFLNWGHSVLGEWITSKKQNEFHFQVKRKWIEQSELHDVINSVLETYVGRDFLFMWSFEDLSDPRFLNVRVSGVLNSRQELGSARDSYELTRIMSRRLEELQGRLKVDLLAAIYKNLLLQRVASVSSVEQLLALTVQHIYLSLPVQRAIVARMISLVSPTPHALSVYGLSGLRDASLPLSLQLLLAAHPRKRMQNGRNSTVEVYAIHPMAGVNPFHLVEIAFRKNGLETEQFSYARFHIQQSEEGNRMVARLRERKFFHEKYANYQSEPVPAVLISNPYTLRRFLLLTLFGGRARASVDTFADAL